MLMKILSDHLTELLAMLSSAALAAMAFFAALRKLRVELDAMVKEAARFRYFVGFIDDVPGAIASWPTYSSLRAAIESGSKKALIRFQSLSAALRAPVVWVCFDVEKDPKIVPPSHTDKWAAIASDSTKPLEEYHVARDRVSC